MQTLSAYLFEVTAISPGEVASSCTAIETTLKEWLIEKGSPAPSSDSGGFVSRTKGFPAGSFQRKKFISSLGALSEILLQEPTHAGQIFITTISWVALTDQITIHASLAVKNAIPLLSPVFTDPRCPSVVKRLLDLRPDWTFGGFPVPKQNAELIVGEESGRALASLLRDPSRTLPVVVVSEIEGLPIWDHLETYLANDLAGLASVLRIDEEASWSLTEEVEKINSCYLGAVRLYWPIGKTVDEDSFPRSSVWTASHMASLNGDGKGVQRVRTLLRRSVMSVASLTVEPPASFRDIQNRAARAKFLELEERANSNSDELQLARLFIEENEKLKEELDEARREVSRQASKAETAEYALSQIKIHGIADSSESSGLSDSEEPTAGEVRHYKKIRNTPSHDVLIRVPDCGHNAWQGASKADKAKKGVEKLEGCSDWVNFYHCSKCTGGGVWRVAW